MIIVEANRCKSCGICIKYCPVKIIEVTDKLNDKGYAVVGLTDPKKCTSCGICARVCPDAAISVYKE